MKKFYSKPAKALTAVLMLVFAMVVAFSGSWILTGRHVGLYGKELFGVNSVTDYKKSSALSNQLSDLAYEQKQKVVLQKKFCKGGTYDGNQTIDITDPDSGISSNKKSKNYEYRLKDLAEFYQSEGYYYLSYLTGTGEGDLVVDLSDEESEDSADDYSADTESSSAAQKTASKTVYGSKAEIVGEYTLTQEELYGSEEDVPQSGSPDKTVTFKRYSSYYNVLYNNGKAIEEKYIKTAQGTTLADYAQKNLNTVSIYDSYRELLDASDQIGQMLQKSEDEAASERVKIFMRSRDGSFVYTNVPAWKKRTLKNIYTADYQNKSEDNSFCGYMYSSAGLKGVSDDLYLGNRTGTQKDDPSSYRAGASSSSLMDTGTNIRQEWADALMDGQDNYEFLIAIDLSSDGTYGEDSIYEQQQKFEWFWSHAPAGPLWIWLVTGTAGMAVMLLLGILQTGRRPEDKQIHSAKIDAFPIELMMLMDLILVTIIIGGSLSIYANSYVTIDTVADYQKQQIWLLAAASVGALGGAAWLLWAVKRYVRRIKKKKIGGSILAWLFREIRKFIIQTYDSSQENEKLILKYVVFVLINLFFVGLAGVILTRGGLLMTLFILVLIAIFDAWVLSQLLKNTRGNEEIKQGMRAIAGGDLNHQIDTEHMSGTNREMGEELNRVRDGLKTAVETEMKSERLKTDLITNVSHDIKTPLTSIINYVDILKREQIADEKIAGYIEILDKKSQRLKQLTEDLVEASKISSGNITLDMQTINLKQLIKQTNGEIEEKFAARGLELICDLPEEALMIRADGRRMYRVLENLYNNTAKYSMPNSRVYVQGERKHKKVIFTIKNMSEYPLNFDADELLQRFVRGDVSRSTEGSGLGLEIARNLTVMQKGDFRIYLDGDLFKVTLTFDEAEEAVSNNDETDV